MIAIRLSRIGKNRHATFRVVVADHARTVKGKAIEVLGSYDPHTDVATFAAERIKHWMSKGARVSPTVTNLLIDQHIIEGQKVTAWKPPKKSPASPAAPPAEAAAAADAPASP